DLPPAGRAARVRPARRAGGRHAPPRGDVDGRRPGGGGDHPRGCGRVLRRSPPVSDSYYGRPYLKTPVWKPEIAAYFWVGGLAGASATLALAARLAGNRRLHRSALGAALTGAIVSPALLIEDLGRPERFLNMFRVFKPTSPMSVG